MTRSRFFHTSFFLVFAALYYVLDSNVYAQTDISARNPRTIETYEKLITREDGVPLFGIFEKLFSISGGGSNPYTSVEAKAELISPSGKRATSPLFWNGGKTFGLRFSPNEKGLWSFNVTSNDSGLDGQKGQFQVTSSSNKGSIVPMKEAPYHFQYENGEPFFFWGETAWAGFINTSKQNNRSRFFDYVDVRAAQGYNVMTLQAYGNAGTRNEGGEPFTNFSNEIINVDYWKEVDKRIEYIGSKGIISWLYMNWGGTERWGVFKNQEARLRFIRYLVARYSAYPTGFTVSGEWTKKGPPSNEKEVNEMGNEVLTSDPHGRMITVHVNSDIIGASGSVEEFAQQNWMSFGDWKQDYLNLHKDMLAARDHNKPVVNSEYGYYRRNDCDGKIVKANSQDVQEYRNATWDIYMAGGYGVGGYGSTYYGGERDCSQDKFVEEPTNNDWEEQQAYVWKFFKSLEWWKLTPADNLISSSQSRTRDQMNHPNSTRQGFAAPPVRTFWALSDKNNTYVAYVRGLTSAALLDLRDTKGNFSVKRYNPRNGSFTEIGTTTGGAIISLAPPDDLDYVFLLQKLPT